MSPGIQKKRHVENGRGYFEILKNFNKNPCNIQYDKHIHHGRIFNRLIKTVMYFYFY